MNAWGLLASQLTLLGKFLASERSCLKNQDELCTKNNWKIFLWFSHSWAHTWMCTCIHVHIHRHTHKQWKIAWALEMAQRVEFLLCEQEDLGVDSQCPYWKLGIVTCACNSSLRCKDRIVVVLSGQSVWPVCEPQDWWETTPQLFTDNKIMVQICNRILFSCKERWNHGIYR